MKTKNIVCGILALTAVLALPVQAQSFLTKGLVAFYPFNGNANDQSGYQNNPLVNSASLARDRFDRANDAVNFSGSQQIQYASPSQIQALTNLTVSCWIQTSNYFSGFHGVVCKATPVNPWVGFQVGVYHSRVQIQIDSTSYTGSVAINDGKWHAVCVVFDHDNSWAEIFVDGQLDSRFYTSVTSPTFTHRAVSAQCGRGSVRLELLYRLAGRNPDVQPGVVRRRSGAVVCRGSDRVFPALP